MENTLHFYTVHKISYMWIRNLNVVSKNFLSVKSFRNKYKKISYEMELFQSPKSSKPKETDKYNYKLNSVCLPKKKKL